MLGNVVEMSLIFRRILGPLVLSWAPNHFVLGPSFLLAKRVSPYLCKGIRTLGEYGNKTAVWGTLEINILIHAAVR